MAQIATSSVLDPISPDPARASSWSMTAIVQAAVRAPKPFNRKRSMTDVPKPVVVGAGGRKVAMCTFGTQ